MTPRTEWDIEEFIVMIPQHPSYGEDIERKEAKKCSLKAIF